MQTDKDAKEEKVRKQAIRRGNFTRETAIAEATNVVAAIIGHLQRFVPLLGTTEFSFSLEQEQAISNVADLIESAFQEALTLDVYNEEQLKNARSSIGGLWTLNGGANGQYAAYSQRENPWLLMAPHFYRAQQIVMVKYAIGCDLKYGLSVGVSQICSYLGRSKTSILHQLGLDPQTYSVDAETVCALLGWDSTMFSRSGTKKTTF